MIDICELTPEAVLYWHQLCEYMRSKGSDGEQHLDRLLPSSLAFAEYFNDYINKYEPLVLLIVRLFAVSYCVWYSRRQTVIIV